MSYEKVRSIKVDVKEGKVFVTSACNNVRPLTYERWECKSISKILREEGKAKAEIELLKLFETGEFTGSIKKYSDAMSVLYNILDSEYDKFNWNANNSAYGSDERKLFNESRKSIEFNNLLRKALDTKCVKSFVISKVYMGEKVYGIKKRNSMSWTENESKATLFFENEAKKLFKWFSNSSDWSIEGD